MKSSCLALLLALGLTTTTLAASDDPNTNGYNSGWSTYGQGCVGPYRHWLNEATRPKTPVPTKFDYIVIGGGAAGSVVAARLSENPNVTVALLEAGKPTQRSVGGTDYVAARYSTDANGFHIETPLTREDVPAFSNQVRAPMHPWWPIIQNEPTRIIPGSQSSMALGGSMTHNNMVWVRGTKTHIDGWGLHNWTYNDLLPFYIRSENVTGSSQAPNTAYHGYTGPIQIADPYAVPTAGYAFVNACHAATGLPYNSDFNGPTRPGCGVNNVNIRAGIRDSSANAYLAPALTRTNLYVFVFATATKINFSNATSTKKPVTTGVTFSQLGTSYTFGVNKEAIISGGYCKTPQLLMLSGVGPKAELNKFKIPIVYASEQVGKNYFYQQRVGGSFFYPNSTLPTLYGVGAEALTYANSHGGLFASTGISGWIFYQPATSKTASVYISISFGSTNTNLLSYGVTNALPKLTPGTITLNSSDPFDAPVVTTNTFGNVTDLQTLAQGIQTARSIFASSPLKEMTGFEITPGPAYTTLAQLMQYVNNTASIAAHMHGTSKMSNPGDTSGVIDTNLRVIGVTGLRVCDTSVIPDIDAHAQATVVAIGERCAEFIRTGL